MNFLQFLKLTLACVALSRSVDCIATTRPKQLAQAKQMAAYLEDHGDDWGWTAAMQTSFLGEIADAEAKDAKTGNKALCTHADYIACDAAFVVLVAKMRFIHNNFCQMPPRTAEEVELMGFSPRSKPTTIFATDDMAVISGRPSAERTLSMTIDINSATGEARNTANAQFLVAMVIVDPEAAAAGVLGKYGPYAAVTPTTQEWLTHMFEIGRANFDLVFDEVDRGKTAWFAVKIVNDKGWEGDWGPMYSHMIP
jgi:hypothetical protein